MPKVKIVCLILATVLASVGTLLFLSNLNGGEIPPLDVPSDDINTYLDKPIDATPSDVEDVRENLFIAHKTLLMRERFYGVSKGSTTSFGIEQQVLNTRYVVGEFGNKNSFKQMVTKGVVPNAYQLYMWGDNYLHRGYEKVNALDSVVWKNSASKLNEEDFYDKFGHRSDKLTGYILNYDTVTDGVLEKVEDGVYTFRFALDTVSATAYLRKEMVTNGNLSGYPTFNKAEIVVTMDADWNVQTLTTDCKYTAKTMGITATCSEDITETFYDFEGDLPEKDFFEQFFDADYSDVDKEKGALDVLLDMFSLYLNGQDLQVALAVNGGDVEYVNALVSIAGLDISDLSKLSVSARLGDALQLAYEHGEGKIYLKYQDLQASTTVDGILGLVDTLAPLLGDGSGLDFDSLLGDIDVDALLANLTYEISEDGEKCVVSLPLSIAGLDIDAKLYADVDGETFTFKNAVVSLGDIVIVLEPQAWEVEERSGDYPEILGLLDLIQNGKIALNANLELAFGGVNYNVDAEALIELATFNVALNANLGNNGSVAAVLYDRVAYVQFGEVKVKLDIANVDSIIELIEKFTGASLETELPELSIDTVLGVLCGITATNTDDGRVVLNLSVSGVDCNVYLAPQDGSWRLDSITVELDGISATVAPSDNFADVTAPADADQYADVTEIIETFVEPIERIINGESYGVAFNLKLTVGDKAYSIKGSVAYDANKTLRVIATVFDGNSRIVEAEVIYAKDTVYLTVNGIKAAFSVSGGSDVDFKEVLSQLLENEQIASIINGNKVLSELIDKIRDIAEVVGDFDLSNLLNVDFREVITGFAFIDGKLSVSLDASALGFDGISADVILASDDGNLAVTIDGLNIASIGIALSATVTTDVEIISIPDPTDYVLNLKGNVTYNNIAIKLELSVDVLNLDVWATAQIGNQVIYLRYLDSMLYVKYGNVALKFDVTKLGGVIDKIIGLVGTDAPSLDGIDLNEILSALSIDLTDASLLVTLSLNGIVATIQPNEKEAEKLSIDGEFADGIALIETFFDPILNVINGKSYGVAFGLNLTVGAKTYSIKGSVAYDANKTLRVIATVFDGNSRIVEAEVIYAKDTVYLTVNGIKAAFSVSGGSDVDFKEVLSQLLENEQIASIINGNKVLSELIDKITDIAEVVGDFDLSNLLNVDFREVITGFEFIDGKLSVSLDASALGFDGISADVTLASDGGNLAVTIDGLNIASIDIALSATVTTDVETVSIPDAADYILNLKGSVTFNNIAIKLELSVDVLNLDVWATAQIGNQVIYLRFVDSMLYVKYGNVALKFDTTNLGGVIDKIIGLVGTDAPSLDGIDLNEILSALSIDLTDASLLVTLSLNGIVATIQPNENEAEKLSVDGYFADGVALIDSVLETVDAFMNADGVVIELTAGVTLNGKAYVAEVTLKYNGGLYATLTLRDQTGAIVTAEIYFVDNTLYFDVNGIRQAIELNLQPSEGLDADALQQMIAKVKAIVAELDNETLNGIVKGLEELPDKIANANFEQFISLFRFENGTLTVGLDLSQLDLGSFTLNIGLGQTLTLNVDGLKVSSAEVSLDATVYSACAKVNAPSLDSYVNELAVTVAGLTVFVRLDLYHGIIIGQTEIFGGTVAFKYVDGAIYVTYGDVSAMLKLSDLDTLLEAIGKFVTLPELSFDDVDLIDTIKDLLDKVQFEKQLTEDGYSLTVNVDGVSVAVRFLRSDDKVSLYGATVAIDEFKLEVASVSGVSIVDINTNGRFVSLCELVTTFADSIYELINAQGYAFGVDGTVKLGDNVYALNANVSINDGNVYATFKLSVGKANMLEGQLWVVDNVLYLDLGDLRFSIALPEKSDADAELTLDDVKQTLAKLVGYNSHLDELIGLVLDLLDTKLEDVRFAELLTRLALTDGKLTLGVDGSQFGLSQFTLIANALANGVQFNLSKLAYKDVALDVSGNVSSYTGQITAPNGDFTTNLKVIFDERNTLYANIDVMNKVIKLRLESVNNGKTTALDILYSLSDNIIKITNGQNLFVSADINNIVDIVKEIDKIVNEFAGSDSSDAMSGLKGLNDIDLKAIVQTLRLTAVGSNAELSLEALGFNITATFGGGALISIVVPVIDGLTLTVKTTPDKAEYAEFPTDDAKYVRIDDVFNDYFYGESQDQRGAIDTLIHTNSWKFDFVGNSEIDVTNDDGTTDQYQIAAGSYFAFYYNVAEENTFKLRAKLTINKMVENKWKEFIILDVAYIDGRIYVTYDSNSSNKNVLRATVSMDAIKECINLLPALYKVVPQIEDVVNNLKDAMNQAQSGITLGELASLFNTVTYSDQKVFTLSLNAGIIEGLGEIYLSAQQFGNEGLQLNQLTLSYNNISVDLNGIVVTASASVENEDGSKSFDYVNDYILSYLSESGGLGAHMNLDTIRELLAGFVITADNEDAEGNRSFALDGEVKGTLLGNKVILGIRIEVDIDKDNNVYLAVKIDRTASGMLSGAVFKDSGGYSYMLLDGEHGTITLARNSYDEHTYCSKCKNWTCTSTILHAGWRKTSKMYDSEFGDGTPSFFIKNMPLSEFTADTKTMVGYILDLLYFGNLIDSQIRDALGKENTNVYGIEDILKSYEYSFDASKDQGKFAVGADLSPIDSVLGALTVNIMHKGDFDNVYYDEDGNFHDGDGTVALTQINGTATMIKIMDATFELNLVDATSGLARSYVVSNNYLW